MGVKLRYKFFKITKFEYFSLIILDKNNCLITYNFLAAVDLSVEIPIYSAIAIEGTPRSREPVICFINYSVEGTLQFH